MIIGAANGSDANTIWFSWVLFISFWLSCLGWGRLAGRLFSIPLLRLNSMSIVMGLVLLNVVGGWLNVLKVAGAPAMIVLLLTGLLLLVLHFKRAFQSKEIPRISRSHFISFLPQLLVLLTGVVTACFFIPTSVFNVQDDFQTYIPRALRMVQAGSLGGSPFDSVGLDSLGAQSFFHGFFLLPANVQALHAFDAVGCFTVALLMVAESGHFFRVPVSVTASAVMVTAVIHPQSVNISPVYSGAVAAMALVMLGAECATHLASPGGSRTNAHAWLIGLLVALLASLKLMLAFFAGVYLMALYLVLLLASKRKRAAVKSAITAASVAAFGIAPWLLLHIPTILAVRRNGASFLPQATLVPKDPSLASHDISKLWSLDSLFWGASIPAYHFLAVCCLAAAVVAGFILRTQQSEPRAYGLLSIIAAAVAVWSGFLWNAHMFEVDDAIRYSIPAMIAVVPVAAVCLFAFKRTTSERSARYMPIGIACATLAIIAFFGGSIARRARSAVENRNTLAYPVNEPFVRYCQKATSSTARQQALRFQEKLEPGATVLVSVAAPFQFDFSRNRLLTVSEAGLISPAINFPAGISVPALRSYWTNYGIRYVLFQRQGEGIKTVEMLRPNLRSSNALYRRLANYGIYFRESIISLAARSEILFENEQIVLFDLWKTRP